MMKKLFTILAVASLFLCTSCKKMEEIPQMKNYPSANVGEYRLRGGEVVLKTNLLLPDEVSTMSEAEKKEFLKQGAQLLNNNGVTAYIRNYLVDLETVRALTFDDDCNIDAKLDVPYPMFVYVAPFGNIYMCPGDTAYVNIDLKAKSRDEAFKIDGTGVSGEVNRIMPEIERKYLTSDSISSFRIERISQFDTLMTWRNQQVARLDKMVLKMNDGLPELAECSPWASDIIRTNILVQHMCDIVDPFGDIPYLIHDYGMVDPNKMLPYWRDYFNFLAPREKHLLDNPLFMIGADHSLFNRLQFDTFEPFLWLCDGIKEYPLQFDPKTYAKYGDTLRTTRWNIENGMKIISEHLHVNPNNFSVQVCLMSNAFGSVLDGVNSGLNSDIIARNVSYVMPYITDPELARIATLTYRDYVKKWEAPVYQEKTMTEGDSIFQRIIEPYKGNVLVVDFWNMSCGPCRGGMLDDRDEIKAMEENEQPVKFLYITDDKPEACNPWLEENEIKGEHIFITRKEWSLLQEKFNFSGIPFHVIVDKKGMTHIYQSRETYRSMLFQ